MLSAWAGTVLLAFISSIYVFPGWVYQLVSAVCYSLARRCYLRFGYETPRSLQCKQVQQSLAHKLQRGEKVVLIGLNAGVHNSGVAVVEASLRDGVRLLLNNEEERFTAIKHDCHFPTMSLKDALEQLAAMGYSSADIHAVACGWDYLSFGANYLAFSVSNFPQNIGLLRSKTKPTGFIDVPSIRNAPSLTAQILGREDLIVLGLTHHDNHAYFSYGVSPFYSLNEPVMVLVVDGNGDDCSTSFYVSNPNTKELRRFGCNQSLFNSLGLLYQKISSTQGGWTPLSSEGRYMGAAAWGNMDRLTNPYYSQLREVLLFLADGQVALNKSYVNWHLSDAQPYTKLLVQVLGEPIPARKLMNPDAILCVEDIEHAPITRQRCDKAAALQLVFEDAICHMVQHMIAETGSNRLVWTGGCALNCLASMCLLQHFDAQYFSRYGNDERKGDRLYLWVPPTPSDTGIAAGAAFNLAMTCGLQLKIPPLQHAFYCGQDPSSAEICLALESDPEISWQQVGEIGSERQLQEIAKMMARTIAADGVLGLFQGAAETGPRALGHRSILANATNPNTRDILNSRVKFREKVRPLAPMMTLKAAHELFLLDEGASCDNYNAYNYMVMCVRARGDAITKVPSIIHADGTSRIQLVRRETDPLVFAFLEALGRATGYEVSVNTSLNVGSPIVQTPEQALGALKKATSMHGLLLVSSEGTAYLAWHNTKGNNKDGGKQLKEWWLD